MKEEVKSVDFSRLKTLLVIIRDNYPQHQKGVKKCLCEACQGLWLLGSK